MGSDLRKPWKAWREIWKGRRSIEGVNKEVTVMGTWGSSLLGPAGDHPRAGLAEVRLVTGWGLLAARQESEAPQHACAGQGLRVTPVCRKKLWEWRAPRGCGWGTEVSTKDEGRK